MALILVLVAVVLLSTVPQWWVRRVLTRHRDTRPDLPGTGGELAHHLLREFEMTGVRVERTQAGSHYDPASRTIRLDPHTHDGRSIAAVAVAAHEFGHALQHARGERGLRLRQSIVRVASIAERAVPIFLLAAPVLGLALRSPGAALAPVIVGFGLLAVRIAAHLVTLPVEYDASFAKALPILREGGYLAQEDLDSASSVLRAAALTYVAQAAASLLDVTRWLRGIRF